jgi:hypothetical protein
MAHQNHPQRCVILKLPHALLTPQYFALDLKISVREKTVLAVFHPDAQELFNVSSDLKRVCWTLVDKEKKLETGASRSPHPISLAILIKSNLTEQ